MALEDYKIRRPMSGGTTVAEHKRLENVFKGGGTYA